MRGARDGISGAVSNGRIIPAYAGSTDNSHALSGDDRDHPRVCGEHAVD